MKKHRSLLCGLAIVSASLLLSASQAQAQIIASDNFNSYSLGAVGGQAAGGSGFTGTWTAPGSGTAFANVVSPGLGGGYGLQTGNPASSPGSVIWGAEQFTTPITGQNVYVSFLWQYTAGSGFGSVGTDNSTFAFALSDTATDTGSVLDYGMRATGGTQTFMVRQGTGTPPVGGAINLGGVVGNPSATYLLLAEYVWTGTGYGTINAWFNPTSPTQTTPDVTASATGLASLSYVYFRGGLPATNSVYSVDNLLIGNTWSDVGPVPEPGSLALVLVGAATLLAIRRRRSHLV
jgi:hypothetical protein